MKKNLLTIGDVSKKTGCSIKSLRYYDSIGLLKPAFIDPHTNYRYYKFEQTRMVEIIQICVYLGIPLKDVKDLVIKNNNKIDYTDLIEYGRKITKEKILNLQNNLNFLDSLQQEKERINSYDNDEVKEFDLCEKYYYKVPLYEDEMNDTYYKLLDTLVTNALNKKLLIRHDYGVIINKEDNIVTKFVAVEVDKENYSLENVIKIPENTFLCKKTNEFDLNKICEMFSHVNCKNKTIIVSPGYGDDFSSPYFEVKCTLNSK